MTLLVGVCHWCQSHFGTSVRVATKGHVLCNLPSWVDVDVYLSVFWFLGVPCAHCAHSATDWLEGKLKSPYFWLKVGLRACLGASKATFGHWVKSTHMKGGAKSGRTAISIPKIPFPASNHRGKLDLHGQPEKRTSQPGLPINLRLLGRAKRLNLHATYTDKCVTSIHLLRHGCLGPDDTFFLLCCLYLFTVDANNALVRTTGGSVPSFSVLLLLFLQGRRGGCNRATHEPGPGERAEQRGLQQFSSHLPPFLSPCLPRSLDCACHII